MGKRKKTYRNLTLFLSYILGINAFISLWDIADPLYTGFFFLLYLFGAYNDSFKVFKIPRILLNIFALLGTSFFLLSLSFDNLVGPLANALLLLLSIKFLEEKKLRDFYQILLLSVLSVSLSTLIKMDITFLLFLSFELFIGIFFLFLLVLYKNLDDQEIDYFILRRFFFFSIFFSITVFLVSWIFFFTLPRVDNPLINIFQRKDKGLVSGISDEISLGEIGEIQLDKRIIFRVFDLEFYEEPYWRVQVFDTYVNNKWIKTVKLQEKEDLGGITYTLILEPTYDTFIPLLNYPTKILKIEGKKDKPKRYKGGYYEFPEAITKPVKIKAAFTTQLPQDKPLQVYLQVPNNIPTRIKKLAKKLESGTKNEEEKIKRIKKFFKNEGFKYSLKLESYTGDPLEDFLFNKKSGNCEYFASATAILLRLMGVPARVVSGFHGAIKNEYGNYYFVIGGMAHVWTEAYVNGKWITVDTTPPYIPESLRNIGFFTYIYDAILTFWYRNIVNFSAEKQRDLAKGIRNLFRKSINYLEKHLPNVVFVMSLLFVLWMLIFFYLKKVRKTPENLFKKLKERLKYYGIDAELPEEILRKTANHPKRKYIEFVVRTYERWKYSPIKDKEELKEAYKVLKKI